MRKFPLALFSGIGRRVAWMAVACGLVVLGLGLLLQAGGSQRQYRDMQRQLLRQSALQAARLAGSRVDSAAVLLRLQIDAASHGGDSSPVLASLRRVPAFGLVTLPHPGDAFAAGGRHFELQAGEREALEAGGTVLLMPDDGTATGNLYLLRAIGAPEKARWVLAELRDEWLWPEQAPAGGTRLAVFDANGARYFGSTATPRAAAEVTAHVPVLPSGAATDLAWPEGRTAWTGAMARINGAGTTSGRTLAVVAMEPASSWWLALQPQLLAIGVTLPLLLLAAALCAQHFAARLLPPLQQLGRALLQLPERRLPVAAGPRQFGEVRALIDAYNRGADAIETQNGMRRVLDELDALLLPGGDYESVIDQVLTRVRAVTRANNVGLALVDPGITVHGRLYVVNAEGGAPVNRVMLDPEMMAALREAESGLAIAHCEPERHGFLEPLQAAGSMFFWVWPVKASDELVAILTVGFVERPQSADHVADTGTLCAQRLGLSLSNNARAERLYHQAHFDPLTQLPNRQLFRERLQQELEQARGEGTCGALLYIDLDHFKRVNDSLGHEAGDKLLAVVAQRLQGCVKEDDTVARLGGDEFTVILRNVAEKNEVAAIAERIVDTMRHPMWLGGRDHHVHASIGVTLFPEDGTDLDQLLHHADLAMYRAKDLGRSGAVFYSSTIEKRSVRIADSGLYSAVRQRQFSLYWQPQYRIDDGRMVGIEALLRWNRPHEGMMTSAEFIAAAEESGVIVDLGGWVLEAACAQIAHWREAGIVVPRVALNLSQQQLRDPTLPAELRRQLERHRLQPEALEFEMSEAVLTDSASAPAIQALSEIGVRLILDDFGTGSTALANLRRYPVSAVKIDRSFIAQLVESPAAAALADTIIVMAHSQRKQVVAEGIETLEQLEYLRERGCDMAQGYFMARPLATQDMTELLLGSRDRRARSALA